MDGGGLNTVNYDTAFGNSHRESLNSFKNIFKLKKYAVKQAGWS